MIICELYIFLVIVYYLQPVGKKLKYFWYQYIIKKSKKSYVTAPPPDVTLVNSIRQLL